MTDESPRDRPRPRRRQPDSTWAVKSRPSQDAFTILPPELRQVMQMRFIEDRSVTEIARLLGKTPADIKSLQARALKTIQDYRERQKQQQDDTDY